MADVTIKLNTRKLKAIQQKYKDCTTIMAGDILKQARYNAPVKTGNLQSSIRVAEENNEVVIKAGGTVNYDVPYARRQEYEHKSKSFYMRRAKDKIMSGNWVKKYYGGLV